MDIELKTVSPSRKNCRERLEIRKSEAGKRLRKDRTLGVGRNPIDRIVSSNQE